MVPCEFFFSNIRFQRCESCQSPATGISIPVFTAALRFSALRPPPVLIGVCPVSLQIPFSPLPFPVDSALTVVTVVHGTGKRLPLLILSPEFALTALGIFLAVHTLPAKDMPFVSPPFHLFGRLFTASGYTRRVFHRCRVCPACQYAERAPPLSSALLPTNSYGIILLLFNKRIKR